MKMLLLGAAIGVGFSANAHADLIESDYLTEGDNLAVYDTLTKMIWLDLNVTTGMSVNEFIEVQGEGIALKERKSEPHGWALPGGYVDYSETLESAALRVAEEETCLGLELIRRFHAYSGSNRDARQHNISIVFIA